MGSSCASQHFSQKSDGLSGFTNKNASRHWAEPPITKVLFRGPQRQNRSVAMTNNSKTISSCSNNNNDNSNSSRGRGSYTPITTAAATTTSSTTTANTHHKATHNTLKNHGTVICTGREERKRKNGPSPNAEHTARTMIHLHHYFSCIIISYDLPRISTKPSAMRSGP